MEVRRTVPVKLDVDSDDAALLEDTVDTFLWSAQYVTDHAFEGEYVTTSKTTLDDETYDDVREATDGFNGGLVQAARNKAAEACKSVVAKWKQGKKASKPHFTSPHVVYDHRTATFHDEYVSLATTDGRPQLARSGLATSSTTGVVNTRNVVATCRHTAHGGHTRTSNRSVAKKKAGSS